MDGVDDEVRAGSTEPAGSGAGSGIRAGSGALAEFGVATRE